MDRIEIKLCNLPFLDTSYSNVVDFSSIESRNNWFNSKVKLSLSSNLKYDDNRTSVVVDLPFGQANNYDYMFYEGPDMRYFYFIVGIEFNTKSTTTYYLELDVFTTYYPYINLQDSFVERCHVDRWDGDNPTYNIEDEGLSIGEYIQDGVEEIYEMHNNIIIASSVPVGKIVMAKEGFGSSSDSSDFGTGAYGGTSWKDGKISSQGFAFIKGFEGFCSTAYQDSEGYWTIGYGITLHGEPELYKQLVDTAPISEEVAAKAAYERICNSYAKSILNACTKLGVSEQYQFDALVSLAYNSGPGSVTGGNELTETIAGGDKETIRTVWENFKTNGGLAGLVARRKEEVKMFLGEEFEIREVLSLDGTQIVGSGWLPQDDSYTNDDSKEGYNGHKVISNELWDAWLVPVTGATVSSLYGPRVLDGSTFHHGIDLACPTGTPVLAASSGTVVNASMGYNGGAGNNVIIEHPNGCRSKYYHLNSIDVEVGQTVKRTQKIGEVGNTGHSYGSHLHWEFRNTDNESINPIPSAKKGDKF